MAASSARPGLESLESRIVPDSNPMFNLGDASTLLTGLQLSNLYQASKVLTPLTANGILAGPTQEFFALSNIGKTVYQLAPTDIVKAGPFQELAALEDIAGPSLGQLSAGKAFGNLSTALAAADTFVNFANGDSAGTAVSAYATYLSATATTGPGAAVALGFGLGAFAGSQLEKTAAGNSFYNFTSDAGLAIPGVESLLYNYNKVFNSLYQAFNNLFNPQPQPQDQPQPQPQSQGNDPDMDGDVDMY
jgi:hypothetical protein